MKKLKNNRILLALIIAILIYIIFAAVVITLFNAVQNNPIDKISMTYIWNDANIQKEYGEIISVGRNIINKTEKDESKIKAPYTIETEKARVTVYVTLIKCDEEWKASSLEVIKVRLNG